MKGIICSMLLLFVAENVHARLGWTKTQMQDKFGIPYVNHLEYVYQVDDSNYIVAYYEGDKVIVIEYVKTEISTYENTAEVFTNNVMIKVTKDKSLANAERYTDAEVDEILKTNLPDVKWLKNPKSSPTEDVRLVTDSYGTGGKEWVEYRKYDGGVYAYKCANPSKVVIFQTAKMPVIRQLRRQQQKFKYDNVRKRDASEVTGKF